MEDLMAKQRDTGKSLTRVIKVEGRAKATEDGRLLLITSVDGVEQKTKHQLATSQDAIYMATLKAIRAADTAGVTDLTIESSNNLVKGHMELGWKRKQPTLHGLQNEIGAWAEKFDSLRWA